MTSETGGSPEPRTARIDRGVRLDAAQRNIANMLAEEIADDPLAAAFEIVSLRERYRQLNDAIQAAGIRRTRGAP